MKLLVLYFIVRKHTDAAWISLAAFPFEIHFICTSVDIFLSTFVVCSSRMLSDL